MRERDRPEVMEGGLARYPDVEVRPRVDDEQRRLIGFSLELADVWRRETRGRLPVDAGRQIGAVVLTELGG